MSYKFNYTKARLDAMKWQNIPDKPHYDILHIWDNHKEENDLDI